MSAIEVMTRTEWIALGARLYGESSHLWEFRCPACGHVQSGASVKARSPDVKDLSDWIWCDCEGRYTPGVGCDWSLFGLFTIHKREVVDDRGGLDGKRRELLSALYAREFALTFPDERGVNIISLRERASYHGGLPVFLFAAEPTE
jgi:hypothetical protein